MTKLLNGVFGIMTVLRCFTKAGAFRKFSYTSSIAQPDSHFEQYLLEYAKAHVALKPANAFLN